MIAPAHYEPQRRLGSQLLRYAVVSAIALAVDAGLLKALVGAAGWHYLAASIPAFIAGASVAYGLSVRFVFADHALANRTFEFGSFVALGLVGLAINAGAIFLAVSVAGLGLIAAKLLAAACTFATNFTLRRQLLFAPTRTS